MQLQYTLILHNTCPSTHWDTLAVGGVVLDNGWPFYVQVLTTLV